MVALGESRLSPKRGKANLDLQDRLNIKVDLSIPRSGTEASEMAHVGNMPPRDQACCCFSAEQAPGRVDLR